MLGQPLSISPKSPARSCIFRVRTTRLCDAMHTCTVSDRTMLIGVVHTRSNVCTDSWCSSMWPAISIYTMLAFRRFCRRETLRIGLPKLSNDIGDASSFIQLFETLGEELMKFYRSDDAPTRKWNRSDHLNENAHVEKIKNAFVVGICRKRLKFGAYLRHNFSRRCTIGWTSIFNFLAG